MPYQAVQASNAAELRAALGRYPRLQLGGFAGTLGDGVLAELGGSGTSVRFMASGRPARLTVFDGAPESESAWEAAHVHELEGLNFGSSTTVDPSNARADGLASTAPPPKRSNTGMLFLTLLGLVVAVVALGGSK